MAELETGTQVEVFGEDSLSPSRTAMERYRMARGYPVSKKKKKIEKDSEQINDPKSENTETKDSYKTVKPIYTLSVLADFYEDSTWNYRCVQIKAQVVAGLGFTYQSLDGKLEDVDEAEAKKLGEFVVFCNLKGESLSDVLTKMWIDYETFGQGFLEIVRNNIGELEEIYHVPAQNMLITQDRKLFIQTKDGQIAVQAFTAFGGERTEEAPTEMLMIKSYNPSSTYYGLPDYMPALLAIQMDNLAGEYNSVFFDNNAIPSMAIVTEGGSLDEPSKQEVRNFFQNVTKGASNAHKAIYIPLSGQTKIKFEKLANSKADYDFQKLRVDNRDEIISAHGVPPRLVGIMSAGQLGGTSEGFSQMVTFRELVSEPRTKRLESLMNRLLVFSFGIKKTKLKFNRLNLQSETDRQDHLMDMADRNIITRTEARNESGFSGDAPDETTILSGLIEKLTKLKSKE